MANQAKILSATDGYQYLRNVFLDVGEVMSTGLRHQARSQTHDATLGDGCEKLWRQLLRQYLPSRYQVEDAFIIDSQGRTSDQVEDAFIIDSQGRTSDQIDVVIFDSTYTSPLHGHDNKKYLPRESVYAVFEAKPTVSKRYLGYAGAKAESVNKLHCTSAPIVNAGRPFPARDVFRPITGLVAYDAKWSKGLSSKHFKSNLPSSADSQLDFVLTAESGFYDNRSGIEAPLHVGEGSLMTGIFRLLQALQELGTVPAIDWAIYERVMELGSRDETA